MSFTETLQGLTGKPLADCTNQELYLALLELVRQKSADRVQPVTGRKLYYISAEFLIGKLLSNNLINLGLYDEARDALAAVGKSLSDIEEVEPEPSLGNGGLGRLAACFLDSLATLGLPGDGVGLRYHFGLFHQSFEDGVQNEKPDPWLTAHSWAEKTDVTYPVELAGKEYTARLYKLAVTGYEGRTNTLNLFDLDTIDESIVHDGIAFDKTAIDKNLTLFLYPDDSDEAGRRLRVYQQYLMVSAGAQLILAECAARGCNYHDLSDYAAIQINDTHPSMVIPELIRLLGEKGIDFDEAVEIVTKTCAYTNHTILAEALEKWPRAYLDAVVPQLMPIIEKLDALARTRTKDESLAIIDKDDRVHMAHMDIHFTHSTNGVAALHTEILKNSELHGFYELYPEKFNNKTNGITFRRWLLECDPRLTAELEQRIGSGFRKDASELEKLLAFADDETVLGELTAVKKANKEALADWLLRTQNVKVNTEAVFDIQSKRLHEYKRQQLNLLYLIHKYVDELYADVFARCYGFTTVGLRYFNVFGQRQDPYGAYAAVIPQWFASLLKKETVFVNGDGETSRDFCYIDNVVQANLLASFATDEARNKVYNVAFGQRTTLNELFDLIREEVVRHMPEAATATATHRDFRAGDVRHSLADITRARTLLGYEPQFDVRTGLRLAGDWYAANLLMESKWRI